MKFIQLAEQNYFLRQGELDRACGPYAVVMALLALGVIERDDLDECVGWRMDRRTKLFKLFNEFDSCSSLFFNGGTFRDKLAQAIVGGFSKEVDIFFFEEGDFEQRLAFVVNSIEEGRVVVMMVSLDGVLHWVVGVGFSESIIYKKLYILDSQEEASGCLCNGTICFDKRKRSKYCIGLHQGGRGEEVNCSMTEHIFSLGRRG